MTKYVRTIISRSLYNLLKKEKQILELKEKRKIKSKRKVISNYDASVSIVKKVLR